MIIWRRKAGRRKRCQCLQRNYDFKGCVYWVYFVKLWKIKIILGRDFITNCAYLRTNLFAWAHKIVCNGTQKMMNIRAEITAIYVHCTDSFPSYRDFSQNKIDRACTWLTIVHMYLSSAYCHFIVYLVVSKRNYLNCMLKIFSNLLRTWVAVPYIFSSIYIIQRVKICVWFVKMDV